METQDTVKNIPAWKSPWVIAWVSIIFIVLGVNLFMVYLAISTSPGLVVEDYYERGQDYEKHMMKKLAKDSGWVMTVDLSKEIAMGERTTVGLSAVDNAGVPAEPSQVVFHAYRPSDATRDFSLEMEQEARGMYSAKVIFPLKGAWDILVSVRKGEEEYNLGRRIDVRGPR